MTSTGKWSTIDSAIEQLDSIPDYLDSAFSNITEATQDKIDDVCTYTSDKVNIIGNNIRDSVVRIMHGIYESLTSSAAALEPVAGANPTDLGSVIDAVKNIIAMFNKPLVEITDTLTELPTKIIPLSDAIIRLAEYRPQVGPDFNVDKFDINIDPITMDDIRNGPQP